MEAFRAQGEGRTGTKLLTVSSVESRGIGTAGASFPSEAKYAFCLEVLNSPGGRVWDGSGFMYIDCLYIRWDSDKRNIN